MKEDSRRAQTLSPSPDDRLAGRQRALLTLVAVGLVFVYAPTVIWLFERWTMSVWHNVHGLFIPPIVTYMAWNELRNADTPPSTASAWGFAFLLPALALRALDAGIHTQLLSAFSLVLLMPGLSLLFLGTQRTTRILFPLGFLLFMLPIPLSFTESTHLVLRQVATEASSFLVASAGVPVFTEGTNIHLAGVSLQVADACSGFSTLYAAMAVALLLAHSTPSRVRRVLILGAAGPLAVAANVLRVALLVLLVLWQGDDILATSLHTISGLVTFGFVVVSLSWIGKPMSANGALR